MEYNEVKETKEVGFDVKPPVSHVESISISNRATRPDGYEGTGPDMLVGGGLGGIQPMFMSGMEHMGQHMGGMPMMPMFNPSMMDPSSNMKTYIPCMTPQGIVYMPAHNMGPPVMMNNHMLMMQSQIHQLYPQSMPNIMNLNPALQKKQQQIDGIVDSVKNNNPIPDVSLANSIIYLKRNDITPPVTVRSLSSGLLELGTGTGDDKMQILNIKGFHVPRKHSLLISIYICIYMEEFIIYVFHIIIIYILIYYTF